jgi:hypothetical protein
VVRVSLERSRPWVQTLVLQKKKKKEEEEEE